MARKQASTNSIPKRIQVARLAAKMTQQAVANKLEVTVNTVARWEAGRIVLSVDRLIQLAGLYGIGIEQITRETP